MKIFISILINLVIIAALVYWNHKVETTGTKEEKWAHHQSIVATAKLIVFFALMELGFDMLKILFSTLGLFSKTSVFTSEITIDLLAVGIVYAFAFNYFQRPASERSKLKKSLFFWDKQPN